jgi:hypothetical protein
MHETRITDTSDLIDIKTRASRSDFQIGDVIYLSTSIYPSGKEVPISGDYKVIGLKTFLDVSTEFSHEMSFSVIIEKIKE